jgi:hypothetical protein
MEPADFSFLSQRLASPDLWYIRYRHLSGLLNNEASRQFTKKLTEEICKVNTSFDGKRHELLASIADLRRKLENECFHPEKSREIFWQKAHRSLLDVLEGLTRLRQFAVYNCMAATKLQSKFLKRLKHSMNDIKLQASPELPRRLVHEFNFFDGSDFAELYVSVQSLLDMRQLQPANQELLIMDLDRENHEAGDRCIACTAVFPICPLSSSRFSATVLESKDSVASSLTPILSDSRAEARRAVRFRCGHSLCQTCSCLGLCVKPLREAADMDCFLCERGSRLKSRYPQSTILPDTGERPVVENASKKEDDDDCSHVEAEKALDVERQGIRRLQGTLCHFLHNVFASPEAPAMKAQVCSRELQSTTIEFVMEDKSLQSEIAVG